MVTEPTRRWIVRRWRSTFSTQFAHPSLVSCFGSGDFGSYAEGRLENPGCEKRCVLFDVFPGQFDEPVWDSHPLVKRDYDNCHTDTLKGGYLDQQAWQ